MRFPLLVSFFCIRLRSDRELPLSTYLSQFMSSSGTCMCAGAGGDSWRRLRIWRWCFCCRANSLCVNTINNSTVHLQPPPPPLARIPYWERKKEFVLSVSPDTDSSIIVWQWVGDVQVMLVIIVQYISLYIDLRSWQACCCEAPSVITRDRPSHLSYLTPGFPHLWFFVAHWSLVYVCAKKNKVRHSRSSPIFVFEVKPVACLVPRSVTIFVIEYPYR